MADPLERELTTFTRLLPSLLIKGEVRKFALIIGDELQGVFENRKDALLVGYRVAKFGPFLVKEISEKEPVFHFTRDIKGKWFTSPSP